jgi:NAD(P)-dependent dehydrogenase (short-subunit alcohol dehydrogenase family)
VEIAGSVIIITGASQGIGEMAARQLADRGASVVLGARNAARLHTIADEIKARGGQALAVPTDVSRRDEIERLVAAAVTAFGRINVLVNNAGLTSPRIGMVDTTDEKLRELIDVNLLAPARCVQSVVPHMRRNGGGMIVNLGSVAGEIATGDVYSVTKFGIRGLSDALRRELRRDNITVVLMEPGFIRRPDRPSGRIPMPGPELVARAIVHAIEHPRRKIITPWPYLPIIFAAKLFPGRVDRILGRRNVREIIKGDD